MAAGSVQVPAEVVARRAIDPTLVVSGSGTASQLHCFFTGTTKQLGAPKHCNLEGLAVCIDPSLNTWSIPTQVPLPYTTLWSQPLPGKAASGALKVTVTEANRVSQAPPVCSLHVCFWCAHVRRLLRPVESSWTNKCGVQMKFVWTPVSRTHNLVLICFHVPGNSAPQTSK